MPRPNREATKARKSKPALEATCKEIEDRLGFQVGDRVTVNASNRVFTIAEFCGPLVTLTEGSKPFPGAVRVEHLHAAPPVSDGTTTETRMYTYQRDVKFDGRFIHHTGDVVEQVKDSYGQWRDKDVVEAQAATKENIAPLVSASTASTPDHKVFVLYHADGRTATFMPLPELGEVTLVVIEGDGKTHSSDKARQMYRSMQSCGYKAGG